MPKGKGIPRHKSAKFPTNFDDLGKGNRWDPPKPTGGEGIPTHKSTRVGQTEPVSTELGHTPKGGKGWGLPKHKPHRLGQTKDYDPRFDPIK